MNARRLVRPFALAVVLVLAVSWPASAETPRPTGLTATATSSTTITLGWTDASSNELGFEIQRSPGDKSTFTKIATTPANATTYGDTGRTANTAYKYRVRALKPPTGFTSFSNVATATTLGGTTTTTTTTTTSTTTTTTTTPSTTVPTPGAFTANATSCAFVAASWNPIFDPNGTYGITKYNLYRNGAVVKTVNAPAGTVVDTGLSPLTTYEYAVTAVRGASQESAKTAVVSTTTPACLPSGAWAQTAGGTGAETGRRVAVDAFGNTIVVGTLNGPSDLGGGQVTTGPKGDIFVAKYSPTRTLLWMHHYPATGFIANEVRAVDTDAAGNVYVGGAFFATLNLGGTTLTSPNGYRDAFVAKYSPSGAHQWSKRYGGTLQDDGTTGIAVDSLGNVVVAGYFKGTAIDFGGQPLSNRNGVLGGPDSFIVKLRSTDAVGLLAISTPCGGAVANALALDANDNMIIAGYVQVQCNFGSGMQPINNLDAFVAKYSSSGSYLWAKTYGGTQLDQANAVAVDGSGNVVIAGTFAGVVNFGDAERGLASPGTNPWSFAVKLAANGGATVWSKAFGQSSPTSYAVAYGYGVAADAAGTVTVIGTFKGTIDFGGGPRPAGESYNAFVAQFSAAGAHLASHRFGAPNGTGGNAQGYGATSTAAGTIVTGSFSGTADFGFGPVTNPGAHDVFVVNTGR